MNLGHPALLRVPTWYSERVKDEIAQPLTPEDYDVAPGEGINGQWIVTSSSGVVVYDDISPIDVIRFPAPFLTSSCLGRVKAPRSMDMCTFTR